MHTSEPEETVISDNHKDAITLGIPDKTDDNPFGFNNADFKFESGIGAERAHKLTERFKPVMAISEGGMGKIVLAQEILSGRYVALKVMLDHALSNDMLVEQFMREAIITARLQHPNVIPVYDLGFLNDGQLYYTMRYIEGKPLSALVSSMTVEDRLRVLRSAAMAVDYAHSQSLWHRDLKPQNILVGSFGDVYVIDWGLVSVQPGAEYKFNLPKILAERTEPTLFGQLMAEEDVSSTLAGGGGVIGTPAYMAPEQCWNYEDRMGKVSDVWAFGIMLFEAVTGRHPILNIGSLTLRQILSTITGDGTHGVFNIEMTIVSELNELCYRMLERNPDKRMQSLSEFIGAITEYLEERGGSNLAYNQKTTLELNPNRFDDTRPALAALAEENTRLRQEAQRSNKKIEMLLQMNQLWSEYAKVSAGTIE